MDKVSWLLEADGDVKDFQGIGLGEGGREGKTRVRKVGERGR